MAKNKNQKAEEQKAEAPKAEAKAEDPKQKQEAKEPKRVKREETVLVMYKGEPSVSNRTFLVKGKSYRMEKGEHRLPKKCFDAFASTPVGKELVKRECLKVLKQEG